MNKLILIITLFTLISCDERTFVYEKNEVYKCADERSKSKTCMIINCLSTDGSRCTRPENLIKKTCKAEETCVELVTQNLNTSCICINKYVPKYLVGYGKKCNYNADCITGVCVNNKCAKSKECTNCDAGEYCANYLASQEVYKCVKYCKEGEVCVDNTLVGGKRCGIGLFQNSYDRKCYKYYSVEDGKICSANDECKSGLCGNGTPKVCTTIQKEADCVTDENGKDLQGQVLDGGCDEILNGKKVPITTKLKYKYFNDKVYKRFKEINIEGINQKKYNDRMNILVDIYTYFGDQKYKEYRTIFEHWHELYGRELIDDEGKMKKDKKCEYEFVMQNLLKSSTLKSCLTSVLVLLSLLF